MAWKMLVLAASLAGCGLPQTVDAIDGTWVGRLAEADLDRGVALIDPGSTLTLTLYAVDSWGTLEQWVDLKLDGAMNIHGRDLKGGDPSTTQDVYLKGTLLRAEPRLGGVSMKMRGDFSDDFELLDLDMRYLGTVYLDHRDEPAHVSGTVGG